MPQTPRFMTTGMNPFCSTFLYERIVPADGFMRALHQLFRREELELGCFISMPAEVWSGACHTILSSC